MANRTDKGKDTVPKQSKNNKKQSFNQMSPDEVKLLVEKMYLRVGTTYYKKIAIENKKLKTKDIQLAKWSMAAIKRDHPSISLSDIPTFDVFAVHPDFKNYQEKIVVRHNGIKTDCYNLIKPLPETPKEGNFDTIKEFLLHLFGNDSSAWDKQREGDPLTIAIDSFRLKVQTPTQLLPVICLVSKEQETGKTTALKFLRFVFGSNATIIGKEHLESQFNTTYADKLVIGVDENFIALEKRESKERIKHIATTDKIYYHSKGVNPQQIDFYGWLWFTSNDENDFMQIDESDKRFWIVKVKSVKEKDPHLQKKMIAEIPAFLHYCMNTPIVHPEKSRFWFDGKHIVTDQMKKVVEFTRPRLDSAIIDFIEDTFTTYWVSEFSLPLKMLVEFINEGSKYKFDKNKVKNWLLMNRNIKPSPSAVRCKFPMGWINPDRVDYDAVDNIEFYNKPAKALTFKIDDWLEPDAVEVMRLKEAYSMSKKRLQ